jgi:hypothetical protein
LLGCWRTTPALEGAVPAMTVYKSCSSLFAIPSLGELHIILEPFPPRLQEEQDWCAIAESMWLVKAHSFITWRTALIGASRFPHLHEGLYRDWCKNIPLHRRYSCHNLF